MTSTLHLKARGAKGGKVRHPRPRPPCRPFIYRKNSAVFRLTYHLVHGDRYRGTLKERSLPWGVNCLMNRRTYLSQSNSNCRGQEPIYVSGYFTLAFVRLFRVFFRMSYVFESAGMQVFVCYPTSNRYSQYCIYRCPCSFFKLPDIWGYPHSLVVQPVEQVRRVRYLQRPRPMALHLIPNVSNEDGVTRVGLFQDPITFRIHARRRQNDGNRPNGAEDLCEHRHRVPIFAGGGEHLVSGTVPRATITDRSSQATRSNLHLVPFRRANAWVRFSDSPITLFPLAIR